MNYISVDRIGNKIFHKYKEDGITKSEVISGFPIELFVKGRRNNVHRDLFKNKLSKIEFDSLKDAHEFIKEYKDTQDIYGQTNLKYQYISHRYNDDIEFSFEDFNIMAIDIETAYGSYPKYSTSHKVKTKKTTMTLKEFKESEETLIYDEEKEDWVDFKDSCYSETLKGGFPQPDKAEYPILAITCKLFGQHAFVVFGTEPSSIKDCVYYQCEDERDLLTQFRTYWKQVNPDILTRMEL